MPEIILIAALAENNAIGRGGDIPWRLKEDFRHFRKLTLGHACVMGDITYESLPAASRPLPGRENVVLTFDEGYRPEGAEVFLSWEEALAYLKDRDKIFLCGGASIYRLGMGVAHTLELTRIHQAFEGDTFFPDIDFSEWDLVLKKDGEGRDALSGKKLSFSFLTYRRKTGPPEG